MNDEPMQNAADPEAGYEAGEETEAVQNGKTEYTGPMMVVEFPLKTEKWQEDMFEKRVFPTAAEFQRKMNLHILGLFKDLLRSDDKFRLARRYPFSLGKAKGLMKHHKEIVDEQKPFLELSDDDKRFEFSYPMSLAKKREEMAEVEALFPEVKRTKKDGEWGFEDRVSKACHKYNCSVFKNLVINQKYIDAAKTNGKKDRKKVVFSQMGMESLAGSIRMLDVSKSGKPFTYNGLGHGIVRGIGDRVWSAWQRKAALGAKGLKFWGKRINIDVETDEIDSVKFQNGKDFNSGRNGEKDFVFSTMVLEMRFPKYLGKPETRVVKIKLEDRRKSDYIRRATNNFAIRPQELTLVRRPFNGGYRYFAQFSIRAAAPAPDIGPVVPGTVGIDIGTGGFTMWGDTKDSAVKEVILWTKEMQKKVAKLQADLTRSDRINNPDCYEADGTIKKGAKFVHTKNGQKIAMKLASLRRQIKEQIKNEKGFVINHVVLPKGDRFIVEKTESSKWMKRSKNPVGPNGKKKRFGKSVGQFGAREFVDRLERRAAATGRTAVEVSTQIAATQFDPLTGTFTKHPVEERTVHWGQNGEHAIDRDLAAAFNLAHLAQGAEEASDKDANNYDVEKMKSDIGKLLEDQKNLKKMKK